MKNNLNIGGNQEIYRGLKIEEIENIFKKLSLYGLDLFGDSIEALQYEHDEDGAILKKAYENARDYKISTEGIDRSKTEKKIEILEDILKELEEDEIEYLNELLETDPIDVFNNPLIDTSSYNRTTKTSFLPFYEHPEPYDTIAGLVADEIYRRKIEGYKLTLKNKDK